MPQTPPTALAASSLATAAQHDPQMRAPDHPRLIRGVSRVHIRDGLLVVGGADRVFLRGTFATESLGGILDLLDGTRGVTELAEETNLSVQAVNAAISLLYAKGLIEDARAGAPADVSEPVLNALSRRAPLTRMRASGEEAAQALVDTRFLLIGEEGQLRIDDVAALLKKTGARHVEIMSEVPEGFSTGGVALLAGNSPEVIEATRRVSLSHAIGLPVRKVENQTLLGPLVRDDFPCPACAERMIQQVTADSAENGDQSPAEPLGTLEALVTAHLVGIATKTSPMRLLRRLLSLDLGDWTEREYSAPSLPGCGRCSSDQPLVDGRPLVLEDSLTFSPHDVLEPSNHLAHYAPSNIALQNSQRQISGESGDKIRAVPLDQVQGFGPALEQLSLRSFGLRSSPSGAPVARWAPTGGNIGSPQLDFIVPEGIEGLGPGVWSFDPFAGRLVQRRSGRAFDFDVPEGAVVAVMTGGLERMGSKYGASAYKLIHLDAGVTRFHMLRVAYELGLAARPLEDWDNVAFTQAIANDPAGEPITSVMLIGRSEESLGDPSEASAARETVSPPEQGLLASAQSSETLVGSMLDDMAKRTGGAAPRLPGTLALAEADTPRGPLDKILQERTSVRMWNPAPVSLAAIQETCREIALGADAVAPPGGCPVSVVLIARNVEGLERGAYTLTEHGSLNFIKGLKEDVLRKAVLQPEYGDSPALFVGRVHLTEVVARRGTSGYLNSLTEVGSVLHAGWLGGLSSGLVGGVFAGILPDFSRHFTNENAIDSRPMFGLALGLPRAS